MSKARSGWLLGMAGLVVLLVWALAPILAPFLGGALLAYLGDPLADRLEARGWGRTQAVLLVFSVLSVVAVLLVALTLPLLLEQLSALIQRLPLLLHYLLEQLAYWFPQYAQPLQEGQLKTSLSGLAAQHWQTLGEGMLQFFRGLAASGLSLFGWLAQLALVPVVTFYLLRDWDHLRLQLLDLLPKRWQGRTALLAGECDEVLSAFLRGQLLVMLALSGVYSVGLMLTGLEFGLVLGLLAGAASIVPYLGVIVGIGSSLAVAVSQWGVDFWPLLAVCAVFGVGQLLESLWLTPTLVGDRIGLHPVAVIFAIMAGGQLAGFTGVLLALPVGAVLMVLLRHIDEAYRASLFYDDLPLVEPDDSSHSS